jgi:hypothetical protein
MLEKATKKQVIRAEQKAEKSRRVFLNARNDLTKDVKSLNLKRVEIATQLTKLTDVQADLMNRESLTSKRIDVIDKMLEQDVD